MEGAGCATVMQRLAAEVLGEVGEEQDQGLWEDERIGDGMEA